MYTLGRGPGFKTYYPQTFAKSFRRTLATFQECSFVETSYTVHYTVFEGYLQCDKLL